MPSPMTCAARFPCPLPCGTDCGPLQDVKSAYLELDKNNDGVLDFEEFLVLYERAEEDELGAWEVHLSPTKRVK